MKFKSYYYPGAGGAYFRFVFRAYKHVLYVECNGLKDMLGLDLTKLFDEVFLSKTGMQAEDVFKKDYVRAELLLPVFEQTIPHLATWYTKQLKFYSEIVSKDIKASSAQYINSKSLIYTRASLVKLEINMKALREEQVQNIHLQYMLCEEAEELIDTMKEIHTEQMDIPEDYLDWISVIEYSIQREIKINKSDVLSIQIAADSISRERGIALWSVPSYDENTISLYPEEVLETAFLALSYI